MKTDTFATTLATLFAELVTGASATGAYALNTGDEGLLRSLDRIAAADASAQTPTGSSIAAHTDHLRYGLSLMNRWSHGDNPFKDADWSVSWRKTTVSDTEWRQLRHDLRVEALAWLEALGTPRDVTEIEANGMIGSIVHLGYHLGAIRQINRATRGPREEERPA